MKKLAFAAVGALALASTAACSSGDPVADASASVSSASSAYCSQLAETMSATSALASLAVNPNATVDQLKEQRQVVKDDVADLQSEAQNLKATQKAAVNTLASAYDQAINQIPADATVAQAGQKIETATKALATALAAVKGASDCSQ